MNRSPRFLFRFFILSSCWIPTLLSSPILADDLVIFQHEEKELSVQGRIQVQAQDNGLLLQGRDGSLWTIEPDKIIRRRHDDAPFVPLSKEELGAQLLRELPDGFQIHTTQNYLICYNTSKAYAQWCGSLYERLYRGFTNYWSTRDFELKEPEFPLVALIFSDKQSYAQFAEKELGHGSENILGYFSMATNRITMYDLTGIESLGQRKNNGSTPAQINQILMRPEAERIVATIVHEATHQISFNCGLQTRLADHPLWFSEGLAIYFEAPDLRSSRGWKGIGNVNRHRLAIFRDSLQKRPADSLVSLLGKDDRFRDFQQGDIAYAEAWALNYFLIHQYPKEYQKYVMHLSQKQQLLWDTPEARLQEFCRFFGDDLEKLDRELLKYISRVR